MGKVKSEELIALFRRMYREHWAYEWGAARQGCVDCSGAFVWALRQLGARLPHGSNSIYRKCVGAPAKEPRPGYAAFKIKHDGGEPERYRGDGIGNVYHIGLVDADGEHVLNAKSSKLGFCRDSAAGWACFAPLLCVDYEEEENSLENQGNPENTENTEGRKARVHTKGGHLNLRCGRGLRFAPIGLIPNGTVVTVTEPDGGSGWAGICYGSLRGFVKAQYLDPEEDGEAQA